MTAKILKGTPGDPAEFSSDVMTLRCPPEDPLTRDIYRDLMQYRHALPVGVELVDPEVIVDLGANYGYSTWELATKYPTAHVYAVEMDPANAELVQRNTAMFGDRVTVLHNAIHTSNQQVAYAGLARTTYTTLHPEACYWTEGITLDALLKRFKIERVDYMKMDIEGAEHAVLEAGGDWLAKTDVLKVEVHEYGPNYGGLVPNPEDGEVDKIGTIGGVKKRLQKLGFKLLTEEQIYLTFRRGKGTAS